MRILAVDYGTRRIGLAVGEAGVASPRPRIEAGNTRAQDAERIASIARAEQVALVLVGREGPRVDELIPALEAHGLRVERVDESLTSAEAWQKMREAGIKAARRKRLVDSEAACRILERYFEHGS